MGWERMVSGNSAWKENKEQVVESKVKWIQRRNAEEVAVKLGSL